MQNRYSADIGDFGKYALLSAVAGLTLRLGIVWYLNPDEEGNTDGGFTHYPGLRECDEGLYDSLQMLVNAGTRCVAAVERANILPAGTVFYSQPLTFRDLPSLPSSNRRRRRDQWLRGAVDAMSGTNLVFLDPDNGFACASVAPTAKTGQKYVFLEELEPYLRRDQSLVIYHHVQREDLATQLDRNFKMLRSIGCGNVWALSFHRKSVPLYFVVATNQHAALLLDRSRQFIKTLWGQQDHFRLHIPGTDATTDNVHDVKPPTMRRDGILASSQIVNRPESKRIGERTTDIGFNNRNRQKVIRRTSFLGTDHCQYVYALLCSDCGHNYGANGSDIFQRKCPRCQSGKPGLRYEERTENDASEKRTR